ncbi:MAG: amidohydrolase family protein [Gammaproteobacteria bacterium]|nr:amidohydrolase family protein [Gammaproteobacteria bacterium]MYD80594.1 amidohydrolase family protein [Gammaproteobacteria bacterium]
MAHDLVVRNGLIVDGTGKDPFIGDVGIDGNTISHVGPDCSKGNQEIDADGRTVTPGFVDLHTHLDAQIGWDTKLTSITWHGVTTALLGNCGVTFAPCKKGDREFLAGMMETVEDIPKYAILTGLPWDWETYGEYLDSIERLNPMINVTGLVGHSATRFFVMGERAIDEQPTEAEIQQIADLAGESVKQGAIGFSVNRHPGHVLPDRRPIPGTFATREELLAISKAVAANGGLMQTVPHFGDLENEMDLLAEEAQNGRVLFSAISEHAALLDERVGKMRNDGLDVTAVTVPRSGGGVTGLSTNNFWRTKSWNELRKMNLTERLDAIRNSEFRSKLVQEVKDHPQYEGLLKAMKRQYYMGDQARPNYTHSRYESLYDIAEEHGEHPVESWLRITLETDGKALFHARGFNVNLEHLQRMISTEWAMPGLGDAGAHVSQMIDSGWSTFVLSHWHRDAGLYSLPEAVRRISSEPARVLGFNDRGSLQVGKKADVNVLEIERLEERQPEIVNDFPGGAPRFIQRAAGYAATICNGSVILRDDEHTGESAGEVLRNPAS